MSSASETYSDSQEENRSLEELQTYYKGDFNHVFTGIQLKFSK